MGVTFIGGRHHHPALPKLRYSSFGEGGVRVLEAQTPEFSPRERPSVRSGNSLKRLSHGSGGVLGKSLVLPES